MNKIYANGGLIGAVSDFNATELPVSGILKPANSGIWSLSRLQQTKQTSRRTGMYATGGDRTVTVDGYRIHTFTSTATFTVTQGGFVEYVIVAGGGGGGGWGGGGGAGGYRSSVTGELSGGNSVPEPKIWVEPGTYTITIGAGGTSGTTAYAPGGDGTTSSAFGISAIGGGGGGHYNANSGRGGGSGGGGGGGEANTTAPVSAGGSSVATQGFTGGVSYGRPSSVYWGSGGGGGAASTGNNSTAGVIGGNGGAGQLTTISGYPQYLAGGGGGHSPGAGNTNFTRGGAGGGGDGGNYTSAALECRSGLPNTGGGGGGGFYGIGLGGSGIVIIRYPVTL